MAIRNGQHNGAHGQAVEVVVHEDEHAQQHSGELAAHPCLDVVLGPVTEGSGAAGLVHQGHHDAQDNQEHQDARVPGVGNLIDHAAVFIEEHGHDGQLGVEVGVQQAAHQDAYEQRAVDLLGDQGQDDGDDRGQQRQGAGVEIADVFRLAFREGYGHHDSGQGHKNNQEWKKPLPHVGSVHVYPPFRMMLVSDLPLLR